MGCDPYEHESRAPAMKAITGASSTSQAGRPVASETRACDLGTGSAASAARFCSSNPRRVEQRLPNASAHSAFLSAIPRSSACCACA